MKHFEGRLIAKGPDLLPEGDDEGYCVAECRSTGHKYGGCVQNAIRLAASWNALDGMDAGELEGFITKVHVLLGDIAKTQEYYNGLLSQAERQMVDQAAVVSQSLCKLRKEEV